MRRLWLLLLAAALTFSSGASAADVVLLRPTGADAFIEEIFHRVQGELRVRAIAFDEQDGRLGALSEAAQQQALKKIQCVACVFFAWRGDTSLIRVWLSGGATKPPALFEAVALERTAETPTLLAARAVDLLSSALATRQATPEAAQPAAEVVPQAPAANPAVAPAALARGSLGIGIAQLGAASKWGAAWGPQIFAAWRLSSWLSLRVHVEGPLDGAHHDTARASARWPQALGLIELEAELAKLGPLTLSVLGGAGAHFLRATGRAAAGVSSLAGAQQDHFTPAAAAGPSAALRLSQRWSVALAADVLLLAPRPRIAIGDEAIPFGEPSLDLSASVCLAL